MFEEILEQLKELDGVTIQWRAEGEYPNRKRTKVQDVAVYQNDGTATIKPAKFVEKAAKRKRDWTTLIAKTLDTYIFRKGVLWDLQQMGLEIAYDINTAVNRIRTGRLKKSFRPKIGTKWPVK